jgi:hypothetical protein
MIKKYPSMLQENAKMNLLAERITSDVMGEASYATYYYYS